MVKEKRSIWYIDEPEEEGELKKRRGIWVVFCSVSCFV
jgi:hypothetical protein